MPREPLNLLALAGRWRRLHVRCFDEVAQVEVSVAPTACVNVHV